MYSKTVLVNGRIHTPQGTAEALLIEGGMISRTGGISDILPQREAAFVDLKGRAVFPGFADSHMHFMSWMQSQETLKLGDCRSIQHFCAALAAYVEERPLPENEWYRGRGWNHARMADGRLPNRHDIDGIVPRNPVLLTRVCGHVALLNTAALNVLGVTRNTRVEGGSFETDSSGELSGIVTEGAISWVQARMPKLRDDDAFRLLDEYSPLAASFGLTQLNTDDMGAFDHDFRRLIAFYTGAEHEGRLLFRVRQQFLLPEPEDLLAFLAEGLRTGDGTPLYQIGPVKLLTDGSLGGRTAFLRRDYEDTPGKRGMPLYDPHKLNEMVRIAHSSGMQVAAHAIGDGALDMCLDAFEAAQAAYPNTTRHIVIHAQVADDRQLDRMKNLHVGAAVQPCFVPSDREMAIAGLGEEKAMASYRWKSMMRRGIVLSGGSDAPVEDLRPLTGIHAAITRQDPDGEPEGGWVPDERLSVAEAVALYTWGGAWHGGNERRRGELREGQDADLVVLDEDPFLVSPADIRDITVAMTMCSGRITWRSPSFE
ncbi:MAG: amidohydrolase [Synergistaceae bacterium]|jgi:predicted amidohydrolase YtcJ|nr:amidohydrolase [Synergistaceae bacterium]